MDNLRILKQVYNDHEAERIMLYDKLSRLLANSDLCSDPVETAKQYIAEIATLESRQQIAAGFIEQIKQTSATDVLSHNNSQTSDEVEESEEDEDIGD